MTDVMARLIGERLKYFREVRGWTVEYLAEVCGSTGGTISRVENGLQNFSFELFASIVQALDIQLDDVFKATEDPILLIVMRLLQDLSPQERGDILFVLGKLLEGKSDAHAVALLHGASGLRRDMEMANQ